MSAGITKEIDVLHTEDLNATPPNRVPQNDRWEDAEPAHLGWRTWLVVFVTGFLAIFTQIYTSTAIPSAIAFVIQDLGHSGISAWVIQSPLLMQAALNPILGRFSDVVDRKLLVVIPPLFAAAGSFIAAKADSMDMLIAGSVLTGVTLATIGTVQSIPAEVLPLKYRSIANGIAFLGGALGGTSGGFIAGAFCRNSGGWRNVLWLQGGMHLACSLSLFVCYWPPKQVDEVKLKLKDAFWACDPIGSFLYVGGATVLLMGLNWSSGLYSWSDLHVALPFALGATLLFGFGLYEWKGRPDGICAHVFFKSGRNFSLSIFASMVEGWMYYSAVNTINTQMAFYMDWDTDSIRISIRQLAYAIPTVATSVLVMWYSTRYKDIKLPLVLCFTIFLGVTCAYAGVQADWSRVQYFLNGLAGVGQAGPLTLLLVAIQFSAPHAYLSTASGLAFSARAIGGAFGSAVLYSIINSHVSANYNKAASQAAVASGLSPDAVPALLGVLAEGNGPASRSILMEVLSQAIPTINAGIVDAALAAAHDVYAKAYQLAWASIIPFVVISIVCCAFLKGVQEMMTEKIEATMETPRGKHVE